MKTINVTIPATISGLWALDPLTPIKSARSYDIASTLCTQLAVRRLSSVQKEYFRELTGLVEAYEDEHGEFIRATDPLFRPMNMATAPDGTLYIVDMYRGIIQQGSWTKKGSYLREQIDAYNLDIEIGRGRIYRLRHDDFEPGPQPHMLDETPAEWVTHLSHPNGWWRDTAQKLLVLRRDLSVVPALEKLASRAVGDQRPRIHAIWTLDGLGALDSQLILDALSDAQLETRIAGGDARAAEFPDLLHPNAASYAKWAATLRPAWAAGCTRPAPTAGCWTPAPRSPAAPPTTAAASASSAART